jgi:hypothetical protein
MCNNYSHYIFERSWSCKWRWEGEGEENLLKIQDISKGREKKKAKRKKKKMVFIPNVYSSNGRTIFER